MGLAEPGRPADEERVVGQAGQLGDGERGGVGEAVGVADDELVERVSCGLKRVARPAALGVRGAASRGRRRPRAPGATSSTRAPGAEHGGGARLQQPAEALGDPGAHVVGRLDEQRRRRRARAAAAASSQMVPRRVGDRAPQLGADGAPGWWVLGVDHGRAEASSSAEAAVERRWTRGRRRPGGGEYTNGARGRTAAVVEAARKSREKSHAAWSRDGCAQRVVHAVCTSAVHESRRERSAILRPARIRRADPSRS